MRKFEFELPTRKVTPPQTFFIDCKGKPLKAIYVSDMQLYLRRVMNWAEKNAPYSESEKDGAVSTCLDILEDLKR